MQKIKYFIDSDTGKDILIILIVVFVGLGSFGLGRLSKYSENSGIKVEYRELTTSAVETTSNSNFEPNIAPKTPQYSTDSTGKAFFASKIGSKYYSIGCSGGKTIKTENKIYFSTEAEAVKAGYEKSASCK